MRHPSEGEDRKTQRGPVAWTSFDATIVCEVDGMETPLTLKEFDECLKYQQFRMHMISQGYGSDRIVIRATAGGEMPFPVTRGETSLAAKEALRAAIGPKTVPAPAPPSMVQSICTICLPDQVTLGEFGACPRCLTQHYWGPKR